MSFFARRRLAKLSRRVKCGAALLDGLCPGWASRVDLDRLDMDSPFGCVLGQVYGHFGFGLAVVAPRHLLDARVPFTHGFMVTLWSMIVRRDGEQSHDLAVLWANEILVRRRAASRRLVAPPKVHAPVLV